jgi:hypothetical protein
MTRAPHWQWATPLVIQDLRKGYVETVKRAVAILGPRAQKDIEDALGRIEGQKVERDIRALMQNKEIRKKVSRFKDRLIDARTAFGELPDVLRVPLQTIAPPFFSGSKGVVVRDLVVRDFGSRIENEPYTDEYDSPSYIDVLIGVCKRVEQKHRPGRPKRDDGFGQRLAAREAFGLLTRYAKPIATGENAAFCKLAAILYGNTAANLQRYCREIARDKTRTK